MTADFINIKTELRCKHIDLLVREIFSVLVVKKHLCDYFPHPLPQHFTIYRNMKRRILAMKPKTHQ